MGNVDNSTIDELILLADKEVEQQNYVAAIDYYKQYLEKNPDSALICNRIGHIYGKISEDDYLEEQIEYFQKALALRPDYVMAIRNLAVRYPRLCEYEKSIEYFRRLFELGAVPDDYFAYACQKIRMGDFDEGWAYYEFRFLKTVGVTEYPVIEQPRWGGQPILGKTLLVQYEQGFGDTFQFLRYIDVIRPLVGKIIFRVQNDLLDLVKSNFPCDEVVGAKTLISELEFDYHTPLMSLPFVLKTTKDTIPGYKSYLRPAAEKVEDYKNKFFDNDCLKIGISWEGMPTGNLRRNVNLKYFYSLAKLKNVKVYSFQKGHGPYQLSKVPEDVEIVNLGETFKDFSDTAAAMENVDLFITSDNALFNLAGAMGKKAFVLLNKYSEWRWFFDEKITPWYDTARIFKKQNDRDSWGYLMDSVIEVLKEDFNI